MPNQKTFLFLDKSLGRVSILPWATDFEVFFLKLTLTHPHATAQWDFRIVYTTDCYMCPILPSEGGGLIVVFLFHYIVCILEAIWVDGSG